ncbi:MobF family relaxase [Burkholderia vietnamiensis]|uniref:MobF family relaxase n=1 Tax=Burkholderia vietnamiensis TaxID=60552 RepID=UPI0009BD240A|nr:MobF family relaxase [Burkholderia vietnamiensis]UKV74411.1 relaxase domain-containing protein [Burkholderia vietnamiensis]
MITVEKINNPDYLIEHSKHEYYTESDNQKGYFAGRLMRRHKLEGKEVDEKTFKRYLDFGKKDGFAGVEFDPAPPKDFSILLERATPKEREELLGIHKEAIQEVIKAIEQNTYYRKTENGKTRYELAKAVGFAHFTHFTARPTIDENGNQKIDCQLHDHIVAFPKVLGQDGKYYSHTLLDSKYEKHNKHETLRYFDQTYQYNLAKGLQAKGYAIERGTKDNFRIKGVSQDLVDEFSNRTKQAENKVGKDASYQDKKQASLKARNKKVVSDLKDLRPLWQERMEKHGFTTDKMESIKSKQEDFDLSFTDAFKDNDIISAKALKIKALSEAKFSTKTMEEKLDEYKSVKMEKIGKHYINPKTKAGKALTKQPSNKKLSFKSKDKPAPSPQAKGHKQSATAGMKQSEMIQVAIDNLKGQYQAKLAEVATKAHSKPNIEHGEMSKIISDYNKSESELNSQLAQALLNETRQTQDFDL